MHDGVVTHLATTARKLARVLGSEEAACTSAKLMDLSGCVDDGRKLWDCISNNPIELMQRDLTDRELDLLLKAKAVSLPYNKFQHGVEWFAMRGSKAPGLSTFHPF